MRLVLILCACPLSAESYVITCIFFFKMYYYKNVNMNYFLVKPAVFFWFCFQGGGDMVIGLMKIFNRGVYYQIRIHVSFNLSATVRGCSDFFANPKIPSYSYQDSPTPYSNLHSSIDRNLFRNWRHICIKRQKMTCFSAMI